MKCELVGFVHSCAVSKNGPNSETVFICGKAVVDSSPESVNPDGKFSMNCPSALGVEIMSKALVPPGRKIKITIETIE